MPSTTDNTSATPSGSGLAEAAEAWQNDLTPGRKVQDTDDEDGQAQQPAKPTGKRAAAKPEPEADEATDDAEDDEPTAGETEEGEEGDGDGEDQGDEGEEDESEEDESESEEGEGDEADPDLKAVYTVTHADGTQEDLPVEELVKGYYRQKDYTKKTQAVAEERRVVQTERQELHGLRAQYAQGLQQLQAAIKEAVPQEPDWEALKASDPIGYAETWADWQRRQHVISQIEEERRAVQQQEQAEYQAHAQEHARRGQEWLLQQIPDWKDAKKRTAERAEMKAFAMKLGYSEEELRGTNDPRAVLLIRQAWQFAKLQERKGMLIKPKAKTPQAAGTKTPVLKPLAVKQPASKQASRTADAKKRHAKEGTVESAAGFFRTIL